MSDTAHAPAAGGAPAHHGPSYVKIWGILLVLLVISVLGPLLGIRVITLLTAFGIAFVKAGIVVKYFMHIGVERKFVPYLLVTMLALMVLMVGALSPDVLKHDGANWNNTAAKAQVDKGMKAGSPFAHEGAHHEGAKAEEKPAAEKHE